MMTTMRRQLIELLRFGAVGGIATLVHALGYLLALSVLAPQAANFAGFAGAVAFSYFGHRYFSFKAQDARDARPKSGLRFVIVSAIGYALNAGLVQMSDKVLGAPELGFWFIALVTPVVTFLLLKFWVFRPAYLSERS
jgi:putative flippase GtrA